MPPSPGDIHHIDLIEDDSIHMLSWDDGLPEPIVLHDSYEIDGVLITTQKVLFCTFNSLCFKHFCVVVLHIYSNWHVKDLAMTSNHTCG